jgi:protein-tyrosine-phosphatase
MKILFVCTGNSCRSPAAAVILRQKLNATKLGDKFEIDSAAHGIPTSNKVTSEARETIKIKYGDDLLALYRPKKITPALMQWADIILVMSGWMKQGLSQNKTFTLKEFAGSCGEIPDPFGQGMKAYLQVADELSETIDRIIPKLLKY